MNIQEVPLNQNDNIIKPVAQEDFSNNMQQLYYQNSDEKVVLNNKLESLLATQRFHLGLDIGAGPGLLSQPLYDHCDHLVLLELLPAYEEILKQKYPQAKVIIKSFLDWQSQLKFDLILCSHILYYFNQQEVETALTKMRNLLINQGTLIIILMDNTDFLKIFKQLSLITTVNLLPIDLVVKSLQKYGQVELIDYSHEKLFNNEEEFANYIQAYFIGGKIDFSPYAKELEIAKQQLLKKHNDHLVLKHSGKLIIFKP